MDSPSTTSTESVMKRQRYVELWYFGPVILAVVMFLLMGTIFERRIEALWQRLIERRQALLSQAQQAAETQVPPLANENAEAAIKSLQTVKTPSQRTLGSAKTPGNTSGDKDTKATNEAKAVDETKAVTVAKAINETKAANEAITDNETKVPNEAKDNKETKAGNETKPNPNEIPAPPIEALG